MAQTGQQKLLRRLRGKGRLEHLMLGHEAVDSLPGGHESTIDSERRKN